MNENQYLNDVATHFHTRRFGNEFYGAEVSTPLTSLCCVTVTATAIYIHSKLNENCGNLLIA